MKKRFLSVDTIERWFRSHLLEAGCSDIRVLRFDAMTQGHSNDTSLVKVAYSCGGETVCKDYVLRLDIEHGISEPYDIPKEFRLLRALGKTGVAVPEVHWMEESPSAFGPDFYVMSFCRGTVADELYSSGDRSGLIGQASRAERRTMSEAYYRELAKIHTVDWKALGLDEMARPKGCNFSGTPGDESTDAAYRALTEWEWRARKESLKAEPALIEPLAVLAKTLPICPQVVLLHGDCKLSNYMFEDGKVTGVLDWEWSRLGDPMNDLAWCLPEPGPAPFDGLLSFDEAREVYEAASGIKLDPARLRFYSAIKFLKIYSFASAMGRLIEQGHSIDLRYIGLHLFAHQALVGLVTTTLERQSLGETP